jgi:hypothetical protein
MPHGDRGPQVTSMVQLSDVERINRGVWFSRDVDYFGSDLF